jgi:glyoxylase-like metal-dependent hydrolase (beta-lactamase superfamily II)
MEELRMSRRVWSVAALGMLSLAWSGAVAQMPPAAPFVTHRIETKAGPSNVYGVEGGGGNSTVIVGTKGVVVVDAKVSKAGGAELLADIAKITPLPVTTVILTHSDGDHVNGLAAFPAGLTIIAAEGAKKEMESAYAAKAPGAVGPEHMPTKVVATDETLTLEGQKVRLLHFAPAHTSGDLMVYLPTVGVLASGDIVATNSPYPRIHDEKNGSSAGWLKTAQGLIALKPEQIIPGHGQVQTLDELKTREKMAAERRDLVMKLAKEGKSLDEVKAAVGDNEKLNYKSWTEIVYDEAKK